MSERYFPKRNFRPAGTLIHWALGQESTAHMVAREFGHQEVFQLLMDRSSDSFRLIGAPNCPPGAASHHLSRCSGAPR